MRTPAIVVTFLLAAVMVSWPQPAANARPALAYTSSGALTLMTASEGLLRTFKTVPPVGTFDFSPDGDKVVFAPSGPKGNGGQLYLLSLLTGKTEQITNSVSYDPREVYSDPEFSPSGTDILFAIHASPGGDAVMASGPFAILNLRSRSVRMLPSTMNIGGYGAAYGGSSRWSPDGKQIFLNFESNFELTDPSGRELVDTSGWIPDADVSFAVDWMGNACVVFIGGKNWNDAEQRPASVLSLRDHQTQPLATLRGSAPEQFANLVAISPSTVVRKRNHEFVVQMIGQTWTISDPGPSSTLRIFPYGAGASVPEKCR